MKFIYRYVKPYIALALFGITVKFLGTIAELILPSLLATILDDIAPTGNIGDVLICGAGMTLCALVTISFNIIANRTAAKVALHSALKIRHDLFERIQQLSCTKADKVTIASLEARLTSDTYNLHNFIGRIQKIGVRAPILLLGGIIVTLFLDPVLAAVLVCTLPFIATVVAVISKRGVGLYDKLQNSVDGLVRVVRENSLGVRVIKALSKTDYEKKRFDAVNREVSERERKASLVMGLSDPSIKLFLNIGLSAVIIVGAYRVDKGVCEPGKIIAFMTYFTMISNALLAVTRVFTLTARGIASADRISEIVDTKDGIDKMYNAVKAEIDADRRDNGAYLEFNDVCFSYIKGKKTLENISFKLKKGQSLGIIGATGSGKTTLLSLLFRFYEPDSGKIVLDGHNIQSYERKEYRKKFGAALQNDFIFEGSVRDNIRFGRDIDDESIIKALKCAQGYDFVSALDGGLDYTLSAKGTNVSGGQRQRLLVARALAANPEILVLDDASSALDYKTDAKMRKAIREEYGKNTTLITVAQRISSVKDADFVIVLEKGRIAGIGKHKELMQSCDIYRSIAYTQMGGD